MNRKELMDQLNALKVEAEEARSKGQEVFNDIRRRTNELIEQERFLVYDIGVDESMSYQGGNVLTEIDDLTCLGNKYAKEVADLWIPSSWDLC